MPVEDVIFCIVAIGMAWLFVGAVYLFIVWRWMK